MNNIIDNVISRLIHIDIKICTYTNHTPISNAMSRIIDTKLFLEDKIGSSIIDIDMSICDKTNIAPILSIFSCLGMKKVYHKICNNKLRAWLCIGDIYE